MAEARCSGQVITAGQQGALLIGTTIHEGEAVWGTADSALPLGLIPSGDLVSVGYPQDDSVYDIHASIMVTTDAADAGKPVYASVNGNYSSAQAVQIVPPAGGQISLKLSFTDYVFVGDLPTSVYGVFVDATALAHDLTDGSAGVLVVLRQPG